MHHTRKTHNAHNETQRRLKKTLSKGHTFRFNPVPHYTYEAWVYGDACYVHPSWANNRYSRSIRTNGPRCGHIFDNREDAEFAKKHQFLVKKSKSSGKKSTYKFAKKLIHRKWRRKGLEEASYTHKGTFWTYNDIFW